MSDFEWRATCPTCKKKTDFWGGVNNLTCGECKGDFKRKEQLPDAVCTFSQDDYEESRRDMKDEIKTDDDGE